MPHRQAALLNRKLAPSDLSPGFKPDPNQVYLAGAMPGLAGATQDAEFTSSVTYGTTSGRSINAAMIQRLGG